MLSSHFHSLKYFFWFLGEDYIYIYIVHDPVTVQLYFEKNCFFKKDLFFRAPSTIQDTTPLKQSCMGDFGGPVFPFLAVGGQGKVSKFCYLELCLITRFAGAKQLCKIEQQL